MARERGVRATQQILEYAGQSSCEPKIGPAERPYTNYIRLTFLTFGCVDKAESGAQNDLVFASLVPTNAQVAELADALDSGSSAGNGVEVRILSWAPTTYELLAFSKVAFVT